MRVFDPLTLFVYFLKFEGSKLHHFVPTASLSTVVEIPDYHLQGKHPFCRFSLTLID